MDYVANEPIKYGEHKIRQEITNLSQKMIQDDK